MIKLVIPALYKLNIGNSKWRWHKMSDLKIAVNNLIEGPKFKSLSKKEIGEQFGYLNDKGLFYWTDGNIIGCEPRTYVPWDTPNMFVPAQWSMKVIKKVKRLIEQ